MNDYETNIDIMQKNILNHKNDIWIPKVKLKEVKLNTNSWFSISEFESQENVKNNLVYNNYKTENLDPVKYFSK